MAHISDIVKTNWQQICMKSFEKKCRSFLENYVPFRGEDLFVSGGVFCRLYHDMPIRDIDVFINNDKAFKRAKRDMIYAGFREEKGNDRFCRFQHPVDEQIVELIGFHTPRNKKWASKFDFFHCTFCMDEKSFNSFFQQPARESLHKKTIVINPNFTVHKYGRTLQRLNKYLNLGFTISDNQLEVLYRKLIKANYRTLPYSLYGLKQGKKERSWIKRWLGIW